MSAFGGFDLFELFRAEIVAHGASLNDGLLRLEQNPADVHPIESLMRAAHSIKGASRVIGLDLAVDLAHHMEDCLVNIQKKIVFYWEIYKREEFESSYCMYEIT